MFYVVKGFFLFKVYPTMGGGFALRFFWQFTGNDSWDIQGIEYIIYNLAF